MLLQSYDYTSYDLRAQYEVTPRAKRSQALGTQQELSCFCSRGNGFFQFLPVVSNPASVVNRNRKDLATGKLSSGMIILNRCTSAYIALFNRKVEYICNVGAGIMSPAA